jgi:hypothetical protein
MLIPSRAWGFLRTGLDGRYGVRVADFGTGGTADNPLLNDVEAGDEAAGVEFAPVFAAQMSDGVLAVYSDGSVSFTGAADGTYAQAYQCWTFTPGDAAPVKRLTSGGIDPVLTIVVGSALPTLSASTYKSGTLTSGGWTPQITAT